MNSFQNKNGNFINSIVDDTIILESVTEELDSYDLDDDSVMESVIDMVMEGNPNNREDATRAGVLAAKLDAKMGDVAGKIHSSSGNNRSRYENRYEKLKSRRDAIENKYSRKLADPSGGKRNYYSDSYGYQVHYGPYDGHENVRKCAKKIMDCGKNVPNRKSPYDPYKVKPKKKANEDVDYDEFDDAMESKLINSAKNHIETKKGLKALGKLTADDLADGKVHRLSKNTTIQTRKISADEVPEEIRRRAELAEAKAKEDVDYDEFDRLVDEAIEEAEYYDHDDMQVSRIRGKIFESGDFDEYIDCDEASEGLFTNDLVASVGKFREVGMSDEESRKAMKVLVVFAISNGMAKGNISKNTTELRKRDMHYLIGSGGFVKSFLSKWYRIADEDDTAKTFSDALNKEWAAHKKMLQDQTDQMRRVEVARAGAANINVNNSNRNYAYSSSRSSSSVFESVDDSDMVLEALFEKRTLDTVLQSYLKQLEKKLNTIEACDKFLALIKQDQAKFNNALKVCADAKIKLDKGQIDEKQFKNLTKSATKQISGYCKTFKLKMSDFGGGGFSAAQNITKEDIANFKQYVTGLIAGVRSIKKKRQALVKEMNRMVGQKSALRKDMTAANEAAFNEIFVISDIDH